MIKTLIEKFEQAAYQTYVSQERYKANTVEGYAFELISPVDFFKASEEGGYFLQPLNFALSGYMMAVQDVVEGSIGAEDLTESGEKDDE